MRSKVALYIFNPADHCAPVTSPYEPLAVAIGTLPQGRGGGNSVLISEGILVNQILTGDSVIDLDSPIPFSFLYFSKPQRDQTARSVAAFNAVLGRTLEGFPMVLSLLDQADAPLYHYMQQADDGAVYLLYSSVAPKELNGWEGHVSHLKANHSTLQSVWRLFNDDCWYSKWNSEFELERKFTFRTIPDTWTLNNQLYARFKSGIYSKFFPEFDRDFQVFDYESNVYEVVAPADEAGYISFIRQADGLTTVKRKWFRENAELRRETVMPNVDMANTTESSYCAQMTTGEIRPLPSFRRKRFDVNFESLHTGNIFGVYFDICRIVDDPRISFAQCEVEYCRTRTLQPLQLVTEEFEEVCDLVQNFLQEKQTDFEKNLYSKLDFVREAANVLKLEKA